uniref:Aminotransferase-like plant mobile domain-containing protein n=1 Tax=Fagus sylvatica TaxID=28930 RepID=A0A2N9I4P2_FAGSY
MLEVMLGEPIDCNQSHVGGSMVETLLVTHLKTASPWERTKLVTLLTKPSIKVLDRICMGKAVYEFLVSGLNRAAVSQKVHKTRGNLHIQGCTALLQIWACEHLGIGQKKAEINQPFPRFLAWTHQRMFSKKAMEAFSNSANVSAMRACSDVMGATRIRDQVIQLKRRPTNGSYRSKLKRTEREALACHVKHLEDELNRVKGLVATVIESSPIVQQNQPPLSQNLEQNQPSVQTQLPIQTLIVDLLSSPSKAVKRGKPTKKKAKAAMVDLASSPSKWDNEGKAAAAMVDLVSSPSKGATSVRYTRAKTRAQKNVMIVPPESEPIRNEWVDAHFLYQPTTHDETVLADLRKKWSFVTSGVDSNEVAISTETYEITGRDVSSLLGDQAQEESSRWISTATTILASAQSTSTQRSKRPKKGKQPIEDDQPGPESVFRSSWVRAMPGECNRIFVPACYNGHFVMLVVDCLDKLIPLILLSAACIIAKSFGAAMRREVGPSICRNMAPRIQE